MKIYLPNIDDADITVNEIRDFLGVDRGYKVNITWKGTPEDLHKNALYKAKLLKIFGPEDPSFISPDKSLDTLFQQRVALIHAHILKYKCAPDFTSRINESRKVKIANYIRTALALHESDLSVADALEIADSVMKLPSPTPITTAPPISITVSSPTPEA